VEVKNLNSFRAAERAIEYEIKRHIAILEKSENNEQNERIIQETRGWDEKKQATFSQRSKEDSHDYRYFPDPDLPKLKLSEVEELDEKVLRLQIKETPAERRERFRNDYKIKESDINFYVLNAKLGSLFEEASHGLDVKDYQLLSNYIVSDLASFGEKGLSVNSKHLSALISMSTAGQISSRGAKDILLKMIETGEKPEVIAEKEGLFQKSNEGDLIEIANKIVSDNENVVAEYKKGKISALQFLVGQGMKATGGSANPQVLRSVFEKLIAQK
jgi:aspartyl-tRNA(Asn)/glutamyl-tRNA(Gln) amidotransferase subunit B